MKDNLEGRLCIVDTRFGSRKAKIIKVYPKVGFDNHGELFVSVVFLDNISIWDGDSSYKLKDIKLID